ncbi:protocadherin Fat 4-like, partial [Saccostrea cucullata]|uniref:protocadherin Fat 4-like n=1 Tax=Saccostrea cuccullata TaxID=36930 RepID=UPI002ED4CD60
GEPIVTADVTIIVIRDLINPLPEIPTMYRLIRMPNMGHISNHSKDDDKDILRYTMIGSGNSQIQSEVQMYFDIGPDDGVVYLTVTHQCSQGDLTYEAIGMYPAEDYFSVNSSTGAVRLIRDLKTDPSGLTTYTLRVVAYDSLFPRLKATADVIISVTRNPFAPSFSPSADYSATVQENVTLGYAVLDINATDVDNDPITFAIVASVPESGKNFFYLDPNTGVLTTKQLLTTTIDNFYKITIQASDGRGRARNATARITITRLSSNKDSFYSNNTCSELNMYAPLFTAPLYFVNVLEGDYSVKSQLLLQVVASDEDTGLNGEIVFDIQSVSNNGAKKFNLDQNEQDGKIAVVCTSRIFRGETYMIMLRATDKAFPIYRRRSTSVPIEVKVGPYLVH